MSYLGYLVRADGYVGKYPHVYLQLAETEARFCEQNGFRNVRIQQIVGDKTPFDSLSTPPSLLSGVHRVTDLVAELQRIVADYPDAEIVIDWPGGTFEIRDV